MESKFTQENIEKSENSVKAKNTPKPTKTTQSQANSKKKSEKQVSTTLKSLTVTDIVTNCSQRLGLRSLSSEVASQLSEDAEHRLRELIELSKQFMLHSSRNKLSVEDVTRASIHSNAELDTIPFSVSYSDRSEDVDIDLEEVLAKEERFNLVKEVNATCSWLVQEGNVMDSKKNRGTQVSTTVSKKTGKSRDNLHVFISSIFSEDSETKEFALSQLATAAWISSVLVELVQTLCDVMKCENAGNNRLLALEAVKNISMNKYIFIEAHLLLITSTLKSLVFIEKPSHFRPKRELLQRNAVSCLMRFLREHANPYNGLEGQLERDAARLISSNKTHQVNLHGALLVAFHSGREMVEDCVLPKLDVMFDNSMKILAGRPTQYSQYLSLLITHRLSEIAALYLSNATGSCNLSQFYCDSVDKFGEVFLMQSLSYQYIGSYLKLVGKKKQVQVYTTVGKMDEKDLEKLMYLTNLSTPDGSSPDTKSQLETVSTKISHYKFSEGEKIKFKLAEANTRQLVVGVDLENAKHSPSPVITNFKTRVINQSQLDISCDLRSIF